MRAQQLARYPYCQCPHHQYQKVLAEVVDHVDPHRGDARRFWNAGNLQSMSKQCHDSMKQSQERGGSGFDKGCNTDGTPLNPDHGWYQ